MEVPLQPLRRVPLWLKAVTTAFVAVLVPVYWRDYGPTNFLYYCDVALLLTVPAIWLESALLASVPLVGILLPQTLWALDFLSNAAGLPLTGLTDYMFDPGLPYFTRFLSFFHFWLPFLLLYLVWRLGYDRRAVWIWSAVAWVLMPICYFLMPAPPAPADNPNVPVNINYVYGLGAEPQQWLAPNQYFALLMVALPLLIVLPAHLLLCLVFPPPPGTPPGSPGRA